MNSGLRPWVEKCAVQGAKPGANRPFRIGTSLAGRPGGRGNLRREHASSSTRIKRTSRFQKRQRTPSYRTKPHSPERANKTSARSPHPFPPSQHPGAGPPPRHSAPDAASTRPPAPPPADYAPPAPAAPSPHDWPKDGRSCVEFGSLLPSFSRRSCSPAPKPAAHCHPKHVEAEGESPPGKRQQAAGLHIRLSFVTGACHLPCLEREHYWDVPARNASRPHLF